MGGDWQHLAQSIFLGLIFSYLLAKLISILFAFKDDNLTITRSSFAAEKPPHPESVSASVAAALAEETERETADSVIAEHGSVRNDSILGSDDDDGDDDSDWEGVESTELDEVFSAATAFVAAAAADRLSKAVSNEVQLQLYGLYKIATEGPCSTPQPSALKMTARAKWQAWNKLGAMPTEEAMQKYIDIVTELYPSWLDGLSMKRKGGDAPGSSTESKGPMGPVFSTFVFEESGSEMKMDAIHDFSREGDVDNLLKCLESGVSVNIKDSEGRAPLHWAVDRGNLTVVELLVSKDADINAKDNEGQTPLHYAAVCEHEEIAQYLLKHNASRALKDNDGNLASDICDSNWPWLRDTEKSEG